MYTFIHIFYPHPYSRSLVAKSSREEKKPTVQTSKMGDDVINLMGVMTFCVPKILAIVLYHCPAYCQWIFTRSPFTAWHSVIQQHHITTLKHRSDCTMTGASYGSIAQQEAHQWWIEIDNGSSRLLEKDQHLLSWSLRFWRLIPRTNLRLCPAIHARYLAPHVNSNLPIPSQVSQLLRWLQLIPGMCNWMGTETRHDD
jgi:hypothetical protein